MTIQYDGQIAHEAIEDQAILRDVGAIVEKLQYAISAAEGRNIAVVINPMRQTEKGRRIPVTKLSWSATKVLR